MIDLKKITVLVGVLRRLNIDLDRGHRWDLSTNFMKNPQFQHFVWNFLNNLIDVQKQNKNSLLIQRAITDSQRRDASSLMGNHYSILKSITPHAPHTPQHHRGQNLPPVQTITTNQLL